MQQFTFPSSADDIEFALEKSYSGTGILRINANMQTYDMNQGGNKLILSYKSSGAPEIYSEVFNGASSISKEFSLPPGFYFVSLEQQDKYSTVIGRKTGYIEVFADETSVLNGIVEKGKWISESYSAIVSNKFPRYHKVFMVCER